MQEMELTFGPAFDTKTKCTNTYRVTGGPKGSDHIGVHILHKHG